MKAYPFATRHAFQDHSETDATDYFRSRLIFGAWMIQRHI